MSRVGLREDRREVEVLVTLIFSVLPAEPRWCHRQQAGSHRETRSNVGAGLPAMRPEQPT